MSLKSIKNAQARKRNLKFQDLIFVFVVAALLFVPVLYVLGNFSLKYLTPNTGLAGAAIFVIVVTYDKITRRRKES